MDYQKQALDFLTRHNLEFRAVLVGDDCPPFCEDVARDRDMDKVNVFPRKTHIHGRHYRCTISGANRGHVSFDFWNSYADSEENAFNYGLGALLISGRSDLYWDKYREGRKYPGRPRLRKPLTVQPYDLLSCIQKSDVGTFHNFCGDFGYDEDSRKAEQVYIAVCKEYQKVQKFFTVPELEELLDIQ